MSLLQSCFSIDGLIRGSKIKSIKSLAFVEELQELHRVNSKRQTGIWRSYKTFSSRGEVKYHEPTWYREVAITDEGDLLLTSFSTFTKKEVLKKDTWDIRIDGNRRFLYMENRKAFEIITLEKNDLVWQDLVTGEKVFFAAILLWKERLQPPKDTGQLVPITLWSGSLIQLITIEK